MTRKAAESMQTALPGLEAPVQPEELEGVVDGVIFAADDGRFSVIRLQPVRTKGRVTVTLGCEPPLVGQQIHLKVLAYQRGGHRALPGLRGH